MFRASERCHQEKRKTINGEDILFAMQTLGFDTYVEPLKLYLQKYREVSWSKLYYEKEIHLYPYNVLICKELVNLSVSFLMDSRRLLGVFYCKLDIIT